jgi:hypothetical protein
MFVMDAAIGPMTIWLRLTVFKQVFASENNTIRWASIWGACAFYTDRVGTAVGVRLRLVG